MGRTAKRCLSCVLTLLLLVLCLYTAAAVLERKDSVEKNKAFFDQKADFDVLFLGSSHTINAVLPLQLWQERGIVSYNLGGHNNRIATDYWVLKNALDYTSPKLVVLDGYLLSEEEKTHESAEYLHMSFDAFPLTATKVQAIQDLLDDPYMQEHIDAGEVRARDAMEFLWPFTTFHSRWNELGLQDFKPAYSRLKGAELRAARTVPQKMLRIPREDKFEGETAGTEYLGRIIEECRQSGIEVLLVYLPFRATLGDQREANRLYDIAAEYGVQYLNFLDMDVVDRDTDFFDTGWHLNPSGAGKVTARLGEYIAASCAVPDRRQDPAYSGWYADAAAGIDYKDEILRAQTQMDAWLTMLWDSDYSFVLAVDDPALLRDKGYAAQLANLGADEGALAAAGRCLLTRAGAQPAQVWSVGGAGADRWTTDLGTLEVKNGAVLLDGEEVLPAPGAGARSELRAAVWEQESGERADTVAFARGTHEAQR